MNRSVLNEEVGKIKYLFGYKPGRVISEQTSAEYELGTDKTPVSHDFLGGFGLPKSPKSKNDYYTSDLANILNQALKGQKSNFLSIFKPQGKDAGSYHDWLQVGDQDMEVDLKGIPSPQIVVDFGGPNQTVVASHNGLLMIYRAMDEMNKIKAPINATMKFGEAKTKKGMSDERESTGTVFNLQNAVRPLLNYPYGTQMVVAAVNPQSYDKIGDDFDKEMAGKSREQFIQTMVGMINNVIQGVGPYGFVSPKHQEEVKKIKGWGSINPEFAAKVVDAYISQQGIEDWDYYDNKLNKSKGRNILEASAEPLLVLGEEMKKLYLQNVQLYLNTYLPRTSNQLMNQVRQSFNPNFDIRNLEYDRIFTKSSGSSAEPVKQTDVKQVTTPRKPGY